ncbi:MAG: hypothetical protein Ct9H300mP11_06770 [Chloroflexota bacterium]|nr:MAG: hypothetical protein Ct9H300mP11_06770 [Chloroflexota bacterium]
MFLGLRLLDGLNIVEASVKSGLNLVERFETRFKNALISDSLNVMAIASSSQAPPI